MGRNNRTVTVYTGNDVNSLQVVSQLEARNLTFEQVRVDTEEAEDDNHDASGMPFVPRIYFGTRFVSGNIQEGMSKELRRLDRRQQIDPRRRDNKGGRMPRGEGGSHRMVRRASPRGVDEDETTPVLDDEVDEGLAHRSLVKEGMMPSSSNSLSSSSSSTRSSTETESETHLFERSASWATVDKIVGSSAQGSGAWTVPQRMEWLKSLGISGDVRIDGILFKKTFWGRDLIDKLIETMQDVATRHEAKAFIKVLLEYHFIVPVDFLDDDEEHTHFDSKTLYRLQCHGTPDVLNSYCLWSQSYLTNLDPGALVHDLLHCLNDLELASIIRNGGSDPAKDIKDVGFMNYELIPKQADFAAFEASLCLLQCMALPSQEQNHTLAFMLNTYSLMMRYFYIIHGFPLTEEDRQHLMENAKFQVGGEKPYSFADWEKQLYQISGSDPRIHLALQTGLLGGSSLSLPFVAFVPEKVDEQLDVAAQTFLADHNFVRVFPGKDHEDPHPRVQLSTVFQYHKFDFGDGSDMSLLEFVLQFHLTASGKAVTKSSDLAALFDTLVATESNEKSPSVQITFSYPVLGAQAASALWYDRAAKTLESSESGSKRANLVKFSPPPMSSDERTRLTTLHNLHVLDTYAHEERFDRITRKVAKAFDIPLVLVSMVDKDRQWFKSTQWNISAPPSEQTDRDISFCGHAILQPEAEDLPKNHGGNELFVVPNAMEDERFIDNPLVTGPVGIRFYAACPLQVPTTNVDGMEEDGSTQTVGTLCLIDQKPRPGLTKKEEAQLRRFAELVQFELTAGSDDDDSDDEDDSEDDHCKSSIDRRMRGVRDE